MPVVPFIPLIAAAVTTVGAAHAAKVNREALKNASSNVAAAPSVTAPTEMPSSPGVNDKEVTEARRRAIAVQLARSGRASTILTDTTEKLGV